MTRFRRQILLLLTALMFAQSLVAGSICCMGDMPHAAMTGQMAASEQPTMHEPGMDMTQGHACCLDGESDLLNDGCDCSAAITTLPPTGLATEHVFGGSVPASEPLIRPYTSPQSPLFRPPIT